MRNKVLACEACGFKSTLLRFEDTISEEELLAEVDKLNKDEDVDGFIVQLPLPRHISEQKVIEAIAFRKGLTSGLLRACAPAVLAIIVCSTALLVL